MSNITLTISHENISIDIIKEAISFERGNLGDWPKFYSDDSVVSVAENAQANAILDRLMGDEIEYDPMFLDADDAIINAIKDANTGYCEAAWIDADIEDCEIEYAYVADALDTIDGDNIIALYNELTEDDDYKNCSNSPADFEEFLKELAAAL